MPRTFNITGKPSEYAAVQTITCITCTISELTPQVYATPPKKDWSKVAMFILDVCRALIQVWIENFSLNEQQRKRQPNQSHWPNIHFYISKGSHPSLNGAKEGWLPHVGCVSKHKLDWIGTHQDHCTSLRERKRSIMSGFLAKHSNASMRLTISTTLTYHSALHTVLAFWKPTVHCTCIHM